MTALDQKALEKARTAAMGTLQMQLGGRDMKHPGGPGFAWPARLPEDGSLDIGAAVEAAILAYQKHAPITEEMVRAGSQKLASIMALKHGFILPEVADYDAMTRACLSASRGKEE